MSLQSKNKGSSILYVLILVILIVALGGGYFYWKTTQSSPLSIESGDEERSLNQSADEEKSASNSSEVELKTVQPVSAKPIAPGKQTYLVSGKFQGPMIGKVTIDPHDAQPGQMQKITVDVNDTNPVTRVYVTVKLDTKSNTFDLKLVSGTATQGTWEGSAPFPNDTLFTNYTITENAESATGKSTTTTTIR